MLKTGAPSIDKDLANTNLQFRVSALEILLGVAMSRLGSQLFCADEDECERFSDCEIVLGQTEESSNKPAQFFALFSHGRLLTQNSRGRH